MVLRDIVGMIPLFGISFRSHHFCFYQAWGWDRKNIPKRRIFPTILPPVVTQWLPWKWNRKNIAKRRIFPTILPPIITQCLPWRWDRKNIPKRRTFPTILPPIITQCLPWRWNRKNIPKRRIFPTILPPVITHESYIIKCKVGNMCMYAVDRIVCCQYWWFTVSYSRFLIRCVRCVCVCVCVRVCVVCNATHRTSQLCRLTLRTESFCCL